MLTNTCRMYGGNSVAGIYGLGVTAYPSNFLRAPGCLKNFAEGSHAVSGVTNHNGLPGGARHPVAWFMPIKSGALSSRFEIAGYGEITGSGALGWNLEAALVGDGEVSSAALALVVSLAADLTGDGSITDAAMQAFLQLAADIAGSGTLSAAALTGLAALVAALTGTGQIAATLTALGTLSADIRSYGDLTPEGLRDAVWNAVAASYDAPGTMGELMNTGAAGLTAQQVWEYATRTLTVDAGLSVTQATQLLEIFQRLGLDPTKPLIQSATEISTDDWTLAVNEAGGTVTVERQ